MLDLKFIRENPDKVKKAVEDRGIKLDIDSLLNLDKEKRALLTESEQLKNKRNVASDEIAALKREGKPVNDKIDEMKVVSQNIKEIDKKVGDISQKIDVYCFEFQIFKKIFGTKKMEGIFP